MRKSINYRVTMNLPVLQSLEEAAYFKGTTVGCLIREILFNAVNKMAEEEDICVKVTPEDLKRQRSGPHTGGRKTSPEARKYIEDMWQEGVKPAEVAKEAGASKSTVYRIWREMEEKYQ